MSKLLRQNLSGAELDQLLHNTEIICRYQHGVIKVAADHSSQRILKVFDASRKNFLRRQVFSKGRHFIGNATKLRKKGVETIQPVFWGWCAERRHEVLAYAMLPGRCVYDAIEKEGKIDFLPAFAAYVADLHHRNIYFRAGHLGNYLLQDANQFAVIDIDNLRFAITLRRRAKNLAYIYDHARRNFQKFFDYYPPSQLTQDYFFAAKLSDRGQKILLGWFKHYLLKKNIHFS